MVKTVNSKVQVNLKVSNYGKKNIIFKISI